MKKVYAAVLVVLMLCVGIVAQDKKPVSNVPQMAQADKLAIRELQIKQAKVVVSFQQMQAQLQQLQQMNQELVNELSKAVIEQQDKVDKTKKQWVLNPDTLEFEKAPEEAKPKPIEEQKK